MISDYLKKNTAAFHDAAEDKFGSKKIFSQTYTVEDYRKIIAANRKILRDAEAQIFRILNEDFGVSLQLVDRRKLPLIEKDAIALSLPKFYDSTEISFKNKYEALGALYVIEGSTLGGNVMAKQLSKTEGFAEQSFHYFGCYGAKTGIMWKSFKDILDQNIPEDRYSEVLLGAEKLYRHLLTD